MELWNVLYMILNEMLLFKNTVPAYDIIKQEHEMVCFIAFKINMNTFKFNSSN